MSKVILYIATSLDGYIADKDGGVSWLDAFGDCDCGYETFTEGIDSLIMGAKTYEQVVSFGDSWPYKEKKTFVLSHRNLEVSSDEDIEVVDADIETVVQKAKKAAGKKNVWLVGGGSLVTSFLNKNLIDEMMIFTIPVLLNEGVPLFANISSKNSCSLKTTESYDNGIVLLHYVM